MTYEPLNTYLRTFRKRTCLSQEEMAFLILGTISGANVSRHETGDRVPLLHTVLGYAFILGVDVPALFEGLDRQVQADIRKRARALCRSLEKQPHSSRRARKITRLKELSREADNDHIKMMY